MQTGLFHWQFHFKKLDENRDPLRQLNNVIPWDNFRPTLNTVHEKRCKSNAGAKPHPLHVFCIHALCILLVESQSKNTQGMGRIKFNMEK